MPRSNRLIIPDQRAVYHVMSRTALDGFPFQDIDKDRMVNIIPKLSPLYFSEILGFCIMGNHFHILVRMIPDSHFSNADIKARYTRFYGNDVQFADTHLPYYRNKWSIRFALALLPGLKTTGGIPSGIISNRIIRRGFFPLISVLSNSA